VWEGEYGAGYPVYRFKLVRIPEDQADQMDMDNDGDQMVVDTNGDQMVMDTDGDQMVVGSPN
jgi:hypothetical protein